ncbi:single-stranded DNA-binding protein [Nocardioides coralli]|uniref:single-stranded DNA-binding protein n=1 Tax=Nocardioides coralli TaxID=2872154 RepID=UPI001CA3A3B0|nr:single-stranded DNA-binding protein [Nocardioides coralli]QZY28316.1 single-stranded DNA-binding protein [Nocardioides coralli]
MNESMVTFQGYLGGEVRTRQAGEATVAWFRVASTPRRFHRGSGEWSDGPTQWYTVNAWRALGEHCAASLTSGDPVVVHGRLTQSTWVNGDGVEVTSLEVDAVFVGHDLNRGRTRFEKATRAAATSAQPAEAADGRPADGAPASDGLVTGWVA